MKYYLAPLEGITTYIYRRAYHTHYRPMEKYFTPFLVPHTKKDFNTREKNDILPEHNPDMYLVPQILANDAKGFLDTVEKLKMYGYDEVNLNLGCPSKTVVSKGRGSGFLMLVVLKWNIYAVVLSKIIFSGAICILNAKALRDRIGYVQEKKKTFLIPTLASLIIA